MGRLIWLLVTLLTLMGLGAWWVTRTAIRIERFDAQRFARMSEQEQAEWLVKQSLARSRRVGLLSAWWARWFPSKHDALTPLDGVQVRLLSEVCLRYDLPHLLNRLPAYCENEKARLIPRLYRALWFAKAGNPQRAGQEVGAIPIREIRALALTHLGTMHLQAGENELAHQHFENAQKLLKQSALTSYPEIYLETLQSLVEHSRLRESPHQIADLIRGLPVRYHTAAVQRLGRLYLERRESHRLLALSDALPAKARNALKPYRAAAQIQQGQAQAGYEIALRCGSPNDPLADALVLRTLHEAGHTALAKRFYVERMSKYIAGANIHAQIQSTIVLHTHTTHSPNIHLGSMLKFVLGPEFVLYFLQMIRAGCETGLLEEAEWFVRGAGLPDLQVLGCLECAFARYRAGDEKGARRLVSVAIAEFPNTSPHIPLHLPIRSLREAGAQELANHFLHRAREHALQVRPPEQRSEYLGTIALAYAASGEYGQAVQTALMIPELELQRDKLVRIVSEMKPHP
ncbi:MAG: hypothetical protein ACK4RG_00625 [Fimbriimonadales bacterium]